MTATPTHAHVTLTDADYARAEQMLAPYRARLVPTVTPEWLGDGERFRYVSGTRHVLADPRKGERRDLFDHEGLAAALSVASGHAVDAEDLPITAVDVDGGDDDEPAVRFSAFGERWRWAEGECSRIEETPPGPMEIPSPDGRRTAFGRDGNVWVRDRDGTEDALTDDAEPGLTYGAANAPMSIRPLLRSLGLPPVFHATWSPDSSKLLVHRLDERGLPDQVLVESSPPGGGRPVAHHLPFPVPGDEAHPTMTWHVFDVPAGTRVDAQAEPAPMVHGTAIAYSWWTGGTVHHLQQTRDARTLRLRSLDPATGATATLVSETGTTRADPTPQLGEPTMTHVLDTGEILWWSQRDGWGHLWLHPGDDQGERGDGNGNGDGDGDGDGDGLDAATRVTSGPWLVRSVLWVDQERRQVWFTAGGLCEDPYVRQICRIGLDGAGFTRLTDDDLDHDAVAPPGGGYVVDRASSSATPPRARVLDEDGRVLVELEAPGTDALRAAGWTPPERFRTTAADGRTPIFGLLWRPHGFDPQRRYPVVEHIYGGPQNFRAGPSFDPMHHGDPEALAALGFAVVAVDGRGTAGRSRAFHDHSYRDLGNAGALDDHVAAIRELGRRHPWLDTGRVGITGQSAGGFAAARGLLAHPGFYGVGVAVSGNHDDAFGLQMWAEQYHGDADLTGLSNPALAANLRGRLLLVHGELDEIVLPAQTLRLVDALITADRDVDALIVPGGDHAILHRRHHLYRWTWDYFVRHLHGVEPPTYRLAPLPLPA
ncbi:S9 family peptidase [Actinomycetospora cinnamomea]|uniref:Dipeptidyl peptidase IV (DPP IV)-like protein n=1 Tax=Actinomycetospora cinnamomea TaxID=663609 RepID=A0A2U1EBB8_9PSEU|nr:DPP IV N-terminal domain-containing protein [Actinomycetospora cinnamomea]PVY97266.1 dipeptidyl peptidase IV (DPP IV)-like protein [Actinomycetospora cinnamomea]